MIKKKNLKIIKRMKGKNQRVIFIKKLKVMKILEMILKYLKMIH